MSHALPDGWRWAKLGNLISLEYGEGLPEARRIQGAYPVYGTSGIVGTHITPLVKAPGIIVGRKGSIGVVFWADIDFFPIDTTYYVVPLTQFEFEWAFYLLIYLELNRYNSATGVPGLNREEVYSLTVPLPPLDEQRRIAAVLRDADASITRVEEAIRAAQEVKQGFIDRWENDFRATQKVVLSSILRRTRKQIDVEPTAYYRQIGIRSHGKGVFHKEAVLGIELGEKRVYVVEPGDFVLNIVFAWEGAVALVSEAERGMCGSHRFPTFEIDISLCEPQHLLNYFKTDTGLKQLGDVSPGGAGRNKTLSQSDFLKLKIPLPLLEEQREIAALLHSHDTAIRAMQAESARLRELKRGLMSALLSGAVRV